MSRGASRESAQIRRKLEKLGCTLSRTKAGHWKVRHPSSTATYTMSGTPSDIRTLANLRADLRRIFGIDVKERTTRP